MRPAEQQIFEHKHACAHTRLPQVLPGLAVGVSWVPEDNALVTLTRVYAGDGTLQSVTYSTAIRAV